MTKTIDLDGTIYCKSDDAAEAIAGRLRTQGFWCEPVGSQIPIRTHGASQIYEDVIFDIIDSKRKFIEDHEIRITAY